MLDHTTNPNLRKTLRDLPLRLISAIGSKIFRTDDCRARERGWQVIKRNGGLSRTYRDPRFDYLTPCPACGGRGYNPDRATCPSCDGSGRLVLDRANTSQPRREQQVRGRP
jgi:RecJ-like exonuclease